MLLTVRYTVATAPRKVSQRQRSQLTHALYAVLLEKLLNFKTYACIPILIKGECN